MSPIEDYRARLNGWSSRLARAQRQYSQFGNARLATGIAAVAVTGFSIGASIISPWWLVLPVAIFIVLAVLLHRLDQEREAAMRGVAYYERSIGRIEDRWIGTGSQGERFRDSKHVYADDLDLFGRGSLFELLSTARTGAGERTLAEWLLASGEREEVAARQEAVAELRPRIDLREEIALMGEDISAAVDARGLAKWGDGAAGSIFQRGSRDRAGVGVRGSGDTRRVFCPAIYDRAVSCCRAGGDAIQFRREAVGWAGCGSGIGAGARITDAGAPAGADRE